MPRHLLDIQSLDDRDIRWLIDRACALLQGAEAKRLTGEVAHVFLESSTRTRVSFELAAQRLGLNVITIEGTHSSISKGETLLDSALTLAAMGVRALVIRQSNPGPLPMLAEQVSAWPVALCNAGDGAHQHPSQALLDAALLTSAGLQWSSAKIAVVGDILHSRVARSDIELFSRLGVGQIRLAGPAQWLPEQQDDSPCLRCSSIDEAIDGADVVICLRIQRERFEQQQDLDSAAYHREWGLTETRFAAMPEHALLLHPGPVNRDVEISASLVEHARSKILAQVQMGVLMRMGILEWMMQ
mgnify:CR=1 FL=1